MLRRLPPTAAPLSLSDWARGLAPGSDNPLGAFRQALADYLGVPGCFVASSGRTALYLLLKALAEEPGLAGRRAVVLPAYTCPAVAKVVLDLDLRPRLVDVSPVTLGFDPDRLPAAIDEQTLAVVYVQPFGLPQPVQPALDLAHSAGAVVIEDAAQSMGARLDGRQVGTQGDFGLYSLGPGKPMSVGGGGVVSANGQRWMPLAERASSALSVPSAERWASASAEVRLAMMSLAFRPVGWWLATQVGLHRLGDREESWGYRLAGLAQSQAAVGLALLPQLDDANRQRRSNAERLAQRLRGRDDLRLPQVAPSAEPIYLRLPVLVPDEAQREAVFQRLWDAGIGVGRMYRETLPVIFPQIETGPRQYPGAAEVARSLLTLPTHHYLDDQDVERIAAAWR